VSAAIVAEYRKFFSTRMWWVILICLAGYVAFLSALLALLAGLGTEIGASVAQMVPSVYSTPASLAYVFPAIIGMTAVTAEFRHRTLAPTFLAEPRRAVVLGAKLISSAPMGLAYGIGATLAAVGVGGAVLALKGIDTQLTRPETYLNLMLGTFAMMLWAMVGVGLGALIRHQMAAIVILLVFNQLIEPILRMVGMLNTTTAKIAMFLPGAAGEALAGGGIFSLMLGPEPEELANWASAGVLLAYALVFAALGYATSFRRDVS
jgi:hypothetical protein